MGHPIFMAAVFAAMGLEYDVSSRMTVPRHGTIYSRHRVHVTRLYTSSSQTLMRLEVAPGASAIDASGAPMFVDNLHLDRYPIYFWQDESGRISDVAYHKGDKGRVIASKKFLVSQLQLVLQDRASVASRARAGRSLAASWSAVERDVAGPVDTHYQTHAGMMGRLVVRKSMLWTEPTVDRDDSFYQTANVTAIVDARTGILRDMRTESIVDLRMDARQALDGAVHRQNHPDNQTLNDILPDSPTQTNWTLVSSLSGRSLQQSDPDDRGADLTSFVTDTLQHSMKYDPEEQLYLRERAAKQLVEAELLEDKDARKLYADYDEGQHKMNCRGAWALNMARRFIEGASSTTKGIKSKSVNKLEKLHFACPTSEGLAIMGMVTEVLVSRQCQTGRACPGLLNFLGLVGSDEAQSVLVKYLQTPGGDDPQGSHHRQCPGPCGHLLLRTCVLTYSLFSAVHCLGQVTSTPAWK